MDRKHSKLKQIVKNSWFLMTILLVNLSIQILAITSHDFIDDDIYILAIILIMTDVIVCLFAIKKIVYPYYFFHTTLNNLINNNSIDDASLPASSKQLPGSQVIYDSILNYKKKTGQVYTLELLKNQAELNALQSQINPHFLYNTIDSIRSQVLMAGESEVADILENLSNFFRYSIGSSTTLISIKEELESIDGYIKIMQFRFPNKFILIKRIDIDDPIVMNYRIPKLTLQPLIENAISHGLEIKPGQGTITLRITRTSEHLHLGIEDNGIGMNTQTLDKVNAKLNKETEGKTVEYRTNKKTGIGLTNVNQRIKLIYGYEYGLNVTSLENQGSCVNILLPIQHNG